MDAPFSYSLVKSAKDTFPKRAARGFGEFALSLASPEIRGELTLGDYLANRDDKRFLARWKAQKDGAAWMAATFWAGGARRDSDVTAIHAVVLDLDGGIDRSWIWFTIRRPRLS